MGFWYILLIVSLAVLFYNYFGYALIAAFLNLFNKKQIIKVDNLASFHSVSFIVCAYNEEECIKDKIINSITLSYPPDKIEYIFITDGSVDKTTKIVESYPQLIHLHQNERKGKSAALNRAVAVASGEILIFSDANTLLNEESIKQLTKHYFDTSIGGVSGEKKVSTQDAKADGKSEGLYWKYESLLKKVDSDFYSVVGAAGELFSLRRSLFEPISNEIILDDFIISMKIALKGYRIKYEPRAYATEEPSFSIKDEQKRKIRIAAGGFQAIYSLRSALKFWQYPRLSFLYISHRVLRWTLSPICLVISFLSSFILFIKFHTVIVSILFLPQLILYLFAIIAYVSPSLNKRKILQLPFYFVFMNVSVFIGFYRYIKGNQSAIWEKAKRKM